MAGIAWNLRGKGAAPPVASAKSTGRGRLLEWRVLVISFSLFLYSFGYGGITSFTALYADANGVTPKSIYLTALAVVILFTRPLAGRLGDRFGYKRVFVPCLVLISLGLGLLAFGGTRGWLIASAVVFGVGFGTAYPVYVGYVMQGVDADRRGAAFGAILAAFDTGIGTGSTSMGYLIQHYGFATAFGVRRGALGAGIAVLPDGRPADAGAERLRRGRRERRRFDTKTRSSRRRTKRPA